MTDIKSAIAIAKGLSATAASATSESRRDLRLRLDAVWEVVEMYGSCGPKQQSTRDLLAAVRNALEEGTPTPPKPDEPTGLGAVVEAIYNNHFVRAQSGDAPWVRVADDGEARSCSWAEIAVVKVLSPGVEAGEPS